MLHTSAPLFHHDHHQGSTECCSGKPASECCKTREGGKPGGCGCGSGGGIMADMLKHVNEPATREEMMRFPSLHLVMRYRKGIEHIDRRVFELSERQIDQAFLPDAGVGRWPVRVLLGHLADAELVFVHRMRRAVGEESPVVEVWDEDAFVDANVYDAAPKEYADSAEADQARVMRALGGPMATIHTLRQWCSQWLLALPEGAWERRIMHPSNGPMTVKTILAYDTWHLEHHASFLTKKLDKMGIPEPAEEEGGCCGGGGGGCGCGH
ncbi:MAG: DinB family protein [Phycisphaerales bacterium]